MKRSSDSRFWRSVWHVALPVTLQTVVMSLLSMTDQVMVGQLGITAVAATGVAAKLNAIVIVVLSGLSSGIAIYAAQFWGQGRPERLPPLLGYGFMVGIPLAGLMVLLISFWPQHAIALFSADSHVQQQGATYVLIVAFSFVPQMVTLLYSALLRATGDARLPLFASLVAVLLNLLFNYLLIFGHAGCPKLGLSGAAWATLLARSVELAVILLALYWRGHVLAIFHWRALCGLTSHVRRGLLFTTMPLILTEGVWVLGESAYAMVYGHMSTLALAAMTMTYPLQGLSIGLLCGLSAAASVLVGQRLGADDFRGAISCAHRLLRLGLAASLLVGLLLLAGAGSYVGLYDASAEVLLQAQWCVWVFALLLWVKVGNMIIAGGILNSGGDSRFVLVMESLATWLIGVPSAYIMAFWLQLPIHWVYLVLSLEELVRLAVGYWRLRSRRWMRNLVATPVDDAVAQPS